MIIEQLHTGKIIRNTYYANMISLTDQYFPEYQNLRVFNTHPGMAKSSVLRKELEIYAKDTRTFLPISL